MRHILLDIRTAVHRFLANSSLLESLWLAIRGVSTTKPAASGKSARQLEAEKQAMINKARYDGAATAARMPHQFLR